MIVIGYQQDIQFIIVHPLLLAGMQQVFFFCEQQVFYLYFLSVLFVDRAHHLEVARGAHILSMRHHFNFLKFQIQCGDKVVEVCRFHIALHFFLMYMCKPKVVLLYFHMFQFKIQVKI